MLVQLRDIGADVVEGGRRPGQRRPEHATSHSDDDPAALAAPQRQWDPCLRQETHRAASRSCGRVADGLHVVPGPPFAWNDYAATAASALNIARIPRTAWRMRDSFSINAKRT